MPLLDHFHGPFAWRPWQSFHARWSISIADDLNRRLPRQFVADAPMRLGSAVEADVVEYEQREDLAPTNGTPGIGLAGTGGVAVATEPQTQAAIETVLYTPPVTDLSMPADFPPEVFVEIKDVTQQYRVVAVVELVSPGNKKERSEREQFAAKCLSFLGEGIGLVVIDIVTERHWNLHNELIRITERDARFEMAGDPWLYAAAYRPVHRKKENFIDLWHWPLAVGAALPTVPLALKGFGCVALNLEATYTEACERSRIP